MTVDLHLDGSKDIELFSAGEGLGFSKNCCLAICIRTGLRAHVGALLIFCLYSTFMTSLSNMQRVPHQGDKKLPI